jgi:membrane-associated HD superfamily phosphohydrolase
VQRIIVQHHGDGIVPYFYHKAAEAGVEVNEVDFHYRGTRPSTKEAAIVMLADCVEAAVHSMDDPTRDQVKEMIDKLILARFTDGQMDDSPLNRRDMSTLAKAFLSVYEGVLHERVKYPGQE